MMENEDVPIDQKESSGKGMSFVLYLCLSYPHLSCVPEVFLTLNGILELQNIYLPIHTIQVFCSSDNYCFFTVTNEFLTDNLKPEADTVKAKKVPFVQTMHACDC